PDVTAARATPLGETGAGAPLLLRQLPDPTAVALTFDDGPDPDYTPAVLDLLAEFAVAATFFVIAEDALRYPGLIRRMLASGHTVASHGWSHRHPWRISAAQAQQEVQRANCVLSQLCAEPPRLFRPPHGRLRGAMLRALAPQQTVVLWSRSAIDWGPLGTCAGVARRLLRVRGGDIVLLHDGRNRHNRPAAALAALPA